MTFSPSPKLAARLPFFYGWVIVGVAFVTTSVGVNVRTAFSLFFPPILAEFGWERGLTAGAFSFGFLLAAALSPAIGRLMDGSPPMLASEQYRTTLILFSTYHEPAGSTYLCEQVFSPQTKSR